MAAAATGVHRDLILYERVRVVPVAPGGAWVCDHTFEADPRIEADLIEPSGAAAG